MGFAYAKHGFCCRHRVIKGHHLQRCLMSNEHNKMNTHTPSNMRAQNTTTICLMTIK
jgi:hypothetical protein